MSSSDFPLGGGSQQYYGNGSPSKATSLGNPRLYNEKGDRGTYNQITGQESQSNPFTSSIGNRYDQHVNKTQKPNSYQKPLGTMAIQKQN